MEIKKANIGFIAGFMEGFSDEGIKKFHEYRKTLKEWSGKLNFNLIDYREVIKDLSGAIKAREQIKKDGIDFLLIFHPAYINGTFIYEIMKPVENVGLWAIEETRKSGPMPLASFVNMEQNAGIAKHNFKGTKKKVKWFYGDTGSRYFKPRFEITVRALNAACSLKGSRIAQIGKLADGHINHMVNPREIYKNLGVDVIRDYEIEDVIKMAESVKDGEIEKYLNKFMSRCKLDRIGKEKIIFSVKLFYVIKNLCKENHYNAVAFSCFPKLGEIKDMLGCVVNSLLNSYGIPAGCEADVLGTISMLALNYLTGKEVALMDLPVFDPEDNTLLLWHCGSAPIEMAKNDCITCQRHYWSETDDSITLGPIEDIEFRESDITVFRICSESESYYYFTGKINDTEKDSFKGSRGWVGDIKLFMEPAGTMDLANTLLVNGLPHHFPMVMENIGKYLEEFAYWMGIRKVKRVDYQDFLYSE